MEWINTLKVFSLDQKNLWMFQIFLVILGTLLLHFFELKFYQGLIQKLRKTDSLWDDAFTIAIHKPLGCLIWIYGLSYAAVIAEVPFDSELDLVRRAALILMATWFFLRFSNRIEHNFCKLSDEARLPETKIDKGTLHSIVQLFKIIIIITASLILLEVLKINVGPILALGGAGTLIIGIAAKDLLANFFGAFMIHMDRPFFVGDWIRSTERNIEGTVEHIGWRLTRIRTFDKRPLYVPNSVFTTISVENPSRMSNRRIFETVGVRYKDVVQLEKITTEIKAMLMSHPDIDNQCACYVNLNSFGASSLDIQIYTFTKTTAWIPFQGIKQQILLNVLKIIENNGAQVAFPTRTLEAPEGISLNEKTT